MQTTTDILLLANRSLFRDMGSGFRYKRQQFDGADLIAWMLVGVGVLVVIAFIARLLASRDKHEVYNSPRALFRALCRAHSLDWRSRLLLRKLARAQNLAMPARLFVEPERFSEAKVPAALRRHTNDIDRLRTRLFGSLPATTATTGS